MDYLFQGPQLKHYLTPKPTSLEGWDEETLTEVSKDKIKELENRFVEISQIHNKRLKSLQNIKDDFELHRKIWEYEFQAEKYYIGLWMRYWNSFIKKPKVSKNHLSQDDIEKAKQYPLDQLYLGNLRRVSGRLVGLCPFHKEKTPSFTIYPENNYFCFGCNAYGDSITFLMQTKQLEFLQAIRELI